MELSFSVISICKLPIIILLKVKWKDKCFVDPVFAAKLLEHAKQINDFAVAHKGKYSDSVTAAAEFYR